MKVLSVFGTRPEAIKMAPVVHALESSGAVESVVCVTAQHRGMLDQVLDFFDVRAEHDLDLMRDAQGLADVTARVIRGVFDIVELESPDLLLVHGDTNTTMSSAIASYYAKVPVGHVEAGLRTGNRYSPWPEEINRRVTGTIASLHFAPTEAAKTNLLREGVPEASVFVTGNTVIDALLWSQARIREVPQLAAELQQKFSYLDSDKPLVLVTGHRRENFGEGFEGICEALKRLGSSRELQIVYPVHLNPRVREPVERLVGQIDGIHLIEPQDYPSFVYLMSRCDLILTDSGGVQEEAPSLGKHVLVMRDTTERPEAVAAGTATLVGTDPQRIVDAVERILLQPPPADSPSFLNPYGDGRAATRILEVLTTDAEVARMRVDG